MKQQVTLEENTGTGLGHGRDDPLKNFVSDVVHDDGTAGIGSSSSLASDGSITSTTTATAVTASTSLVQPPAPVSSSTTSSSSSSLRYTPQLDHDEDDDDDEDEMTFRPSWFTSTLLARRLLAKSSVGIASTVYQRSTSSVANAAAAAPVGLQGISVSLPEYIADCSDDNDEGNPILLGLYVSTTFRNTAQGSNISLSIDWWDHLESTEPLYPGFPLSEAGLPRVSLIGYVERIDLSSSSPSQQKSLEECFLAAHPDSEVWLPGNPDSPHGGFWARMVVTQAYWIGGFGDLQQIGWINMTEWRGIGKYESDDELGDGSGRGWEDVRLPGE